MSRSRFLFEGLLQLCIAAACLVAGIAAYKLLLHPLLRSVFSLGPQASSIVNRLGMFAVIATTYWGYVRFAEHRPVTELAPRWRWTLLAAAAGSLSIGVTILALYATGHYQVLSTRGLAPAADVLGTLWVAAVLEEVAFRAMLFRLLEQRVGTLAAAVTSALVFGVAHMANNGVSALTLLVVTLAGLMWAGVFVLSRNVWVTAAHHCCWNATIFAIGLPLSGEADVRAKAPLETVYHGSTWWTGGSFGPEDSLISVAVSAAICAGLWYAARRRGLLAAPPAPVSVPASR